MDVQISATRSIRLQPRTSEENKCHRPIVFEDIKDLLKPCKKNLTIAKSAVAGATNSAKAGELKKSTAMSK